MAGGYPPTPARTRQPQPPLLQSDPSLMRQYECEMALSCAMSLPDEDGDDAFAAVIRHGDVQEVHSRRVDVDVHYMQASAPVVLCMSLVPSDRLKKMRPAAVPVQEMLKCAGDYFALQARLLMANVKQVYADYAECSVCMDESKALVVIVACGHRACCGGCVDQLQKPECPICRQRIQATLAV